MMQNSVLLKYSYLMRKSIISVPTTINSQLQTRNMLFNRYPQICFLIYLHGSVLRCFYLFSQTLLNNNHFRIQSDATSIWLQQVEGCFEPFIAFNGGSPVFETYVSRKWLRPIFYSHVFSKQFTSPKVWSIKVNIENLNFEVIEIGSWSASLAVNVKSNLAT